MCDPAIFHQRLSMTNAGDLHIDYRPLHVTDAVEAFSEHPGQFAEVCTDLQSASTWDQLYHNLVE